MLKTSSTSANGRQRRRQQAHRDREGEQRLSGVKCFWCQFFWCQTFLVSTVFGAKGVKCFWCQIFLMSNVSGANSCLCQRCNHHLLSCSHHPFGIFGLCVCLVATLGCILDAGILNSFEDTRILMYGRVLQLSGTDVVVRHTVGY